MKKLISLIVLTFPLISVSTAYSEETWITEEVLRQLTEIRQEIKSLRSEVSQLRSTVVSNAKGKRNPIVKKVELGDSPILGSKDAAIGIVEFSDYQCPYCRRHFSNTLPKIKEQYINTGKVKYVLQDFPLSFHPQAKPAAIAVKCAEKQGEGHYWSMHHELFGKSGRKLKKDTYTDLAKTFNLDQKKFDECLLDPLVDKEVEKSLAYGQSLGVTGTPAFFVGRIKNGSLVNAYRISGAQSFSAFSRKIDALLAKNKS